MAQKYRMLALAKLPQARAGDEFECSHVHAKALHAIGKARYLTRDMEAGAPPPTPVAPINATDAAVKLAAERGIDLATITGSGKDGRILASDIEKA